MESERDQALRRAMGYMESMVAEGKVLPEPGADPNFDRVYGKARPAKRRADVPIPHKLIARGTGVEVWLTDKPEYIVLGSPLDDENDETAHNCDEMGCGACHVIWRSEVTPAAIPSLSADPPPPHYGTFPGERCACPACAAGPAEEAKVYPATAQPAWPLADQAHPPLWADADEAEAGLLGEPAGPEKAAQAPVRTHEWSFEGREAIVTVETGGNFDHPDVCMDDGWGDRDQILGAEILRLAGRAQAAEAKSAELREAAGSVGRLHVTLRQRAEAAEAALAEAEAHAAELADDRDRIHRALNDVSVALAEAEAGWRGEADRARIAEDNLADAETALAAAEGRADVAEERAADRDALHADHEQGLEINAELTAALAALLGEPPPEPCSPGCRTPHLSAKAGEAVDRALRRWAETERSELRLLDERDALHDSIDAIADQLGVEEEWTSQTDRGQCAVEAAAALQDQLKGVLLQHGELLADLGELRAQEASAGNYVIRSMRELRKALQSRGLWRPAGQGEPGGGTAGSAIEAIDRLTAELAGANRKRLLWGERLVDTEDERNRLMAERDKMKVWAAEEAAKAMKAQGELDEARASARHNAEGWEGEKRVLVEVREEGRRQGSEEAFDLLDESGCAITSLRCGYPGEVADDLTQRIQLFLKRADEGQPGGQ